MFAHYSSWQIKRLNLTIKGQAGIAAGEYVSGGYFRGLAVRPAAGRLIIPDDDRAVASPVAVVSHAFSQRRFGGAANAAGQPILIDNLPFTVVGVAPPEFFGVDPAAAPDVYLPLHTNEFLGAGNRFGFRPENYLARNYYWIQVMGRLRPGVSLAQAQAELAPAFQQWVGGTADNDRERANLPALVIGPGAGGLGSLRRQYSRPLYVLMTLVAMILALALACANVANLLLARAAARRREMALRLKRGRGPASDCAPIADRKPSDGVAGRGPRGIVRDLGDSFPYAAAGQRPGELPRARGIELARAGRRGRTFLADGRTVRFGSGAAGHARGRHAGPESDASGPVRWPHSFGHISPSHMLVVGQIAISLLMLVAAGLFVRTLSNLQSIELGFNRENVLLFQLDDRKAGHKDPEIAAFYGDLRQRFHAIPGVGDASLSEDSLIEAGTGLPIGVSGAPPHPENRILNVGPAFFSTMQIPILAGRDFQESDRPGSPAVAVINEVFAKSNFGDRNPLGQHLIMRKGGKGGDLARDVEIVGVSRNARYGGLKEALPPLLYVPYNQGYPQPDQMVYALRTSGDPLRYVNSVREVVRQADARVPVSEVRTQAADIDRTINQEITFARLCSGFAILALAIACVGLYGAVSYNVGRRTGEIGIRMALGAQRGGVVRMVLREVLALAAVGLAIDWPRRSARRNSSRPFCTE